MVSRVLRNHELWDFSTERKSNTLFNLVARVNAIMTTIPQLTEKQTEALDVLVDLHRQSRQGNPEARAAFLSAALLLA
jgi:hypothetical protein